MGGLSDRATISLGLVFQISTISFVLWKICLAQDVPANFVFGDSLVDVGNNNYIVSLSKANYVPNGIDFGKPTGRYTNGRTIVDIIGKFSIFPIECFFFFHRFNKQGWLINFSLNRSAAGVSIMLQVEVGRINLDAQIDNFANTRQDIVSRIGLPAALKLFSRALFSVTMGSNDFINNYLAPVISIPEQKLISPERLYNLGARKIIVTNVGPIGCIPFERETTLAAGDFCVEKPNQLARLFNIQLKSLVKELSTNLEGSKFVYADVYRIVDDIIQNHISYGFEYANSACCYVAGRFGGLIPCGPPSIVCRDRSKYIFWDPYHPSDAANVIIARRLLYGDTNDISPMNVVQLYQS
ncbi:unnamed protein product [Prunus armeniaca]|uniref:GDSL esterase/lipase n=1 Tax=Prunus armeniaca TaxID=36596 RepID=A0A6J5VVQ6_PRUAR|nr:unnamed protein product [Prunus armeniaca]